MLKLYPRDKFTQGYLIKREDFFFETIRKRVPNPLYHSGYIEYSCEHYDRVKTHLFCPDCGRRVGKTEVCANDKTVIVPETVLRKCFTDTSEKEIADTGKFTYHGQEVSVLLLCRARGSFYDRVGDKIDTNGLGYLRTLKPRSCTHALIYNTDGLYLEWKDIAKKVIFDLDTYYEDYD